MKDTSTAPQQLCCYQCGKVIKRGQRYIQTNPIILMVRLGIDFPKAYHPRCHAIAERAAARQMQNGGVA